MLTKRIIACLDVRDGMVVKGRKFQDHEVLGEVLDFSMRYRDAGADELVFYDITASAEGRCVSTDWVSAVAKKLDIPFCVAGGIRSEADARQVLHAGADKISINSPAIERPELIRELSLVFGAQCIVVGVDTKRENGDFFVYQYTGSSKTIRSTPRKTMDWIQEVEALGAGEIVLNCMDADGTRQGFDAEQLRLARSCVSVPLIASGGAGKAQDFIDIFANAAVDGALAAGIFHRREVEIPKLKMELKAAGVKVRI